MRFGFDLRSIIHQSSLKDPDHFQTAEESKIGSDPSLVRSRADSRCSACATRRSTALRTRRCGNIGRVEQRNNEPFFTGYFFPLSGRWALFGKLLVGTCTVHVAQTQFYLRPILSLSHSFSLALSLASAFSRSAKILFKIVKPKAEITPLCTARRFTAELSID